MAAILAVSQRRADLCMGGVKLEPERVKLKNFLC
jgi:hypothetical protein